MKDNIRLYLAATAVICLGNPQPAQALNLLVNPGAETGDLQGWVDPDEAWGAAAEIAPHAGSKFFWPSRKQLEYTEMYQDIDVREEAAAIDAGRLYLHLSGWLANWDQYPHDQATLAVQAQDQNGAQLLYLSRSHRNPLWARYQLDSLIPAGTRTLRVELIARRFVGADNDAYFDDLSLEVDSQAPAYSVTITPQGGRAEVPVGGTLQLVAGTTGGVDAQYLWSSSFDAIATVDTNGLVSASQPGRFTVQAEGTTTRAVGYLDLVAFSSNSLVVTAPAEGAEWVAGLTNDIAWELKGSIPPVAIAYRVGGSDWTPIAEGVDAAVSRFAWSVPDTQVTLNQCQFRLSWSGDEAISPSFSIKPAARPPIGLSLQMYAGLTITGQVGDRVLIEYAGQMTPNDWQTLDTITLTNSPYLWFDVASPGVPCRFYRAVAAP